jgi:hypothetical protein
VAAPAEQQQLTQALLGHIQESAFPAAAQLDRVEQLISTRDELETYIAILTQRVEASNYPPSSLVDRIQRLLRVLKRLDLEEQSER